MKRIALVAFNGESGCFIHVLLNSLDMANKGHEVKIVVEGAATALVPEMVEPGSPLHGLYSQAREKKLIDAVCRACSAKNGVLEAVEAAGLPIADEMAGHPSIRRYMEAGYEIVTF